MGTISVCYPNPLSAFPAFSILVQIVSSIYLPCDPSSLSVRLSPDNQRHSRFPLCHQAAIALCGFVLASPVKHQASKGTSRQHCAEVQTLAGAPSITLTMQGYTRRPEKAETSPGMFRGSPA